MQTNETTAPAPDAAAVALIPVGYRDGKPYFYTEATCSGCGAAYGYGCC